VTLRPSRNELDCRVHDSAVCAADGLALRMAAWVRDNSVSRAERREAAAACAPRRTRTRPAALRSSRLHEPATGAWGFFT
jgi:hypothetical protein